MTDGREHGESERDDDIVAAEYVLGVLSAAERDDAARRIGTDRAFSALVATWEDRLSAMNDAYGEIAPPTGIWNGIEGRLFVDRAADTAVRPGFWSSLALWRGLTLASVVVAAVLAVVALRGAGDVAVPAPELVASLSAADSDASFIALRQTDGTLRITSSGAAAAEGRDHELWVIAGDDAPVSLGLVPSAGTLTAELPAQLAALDPETLTLAVTLEQAGGSPDGTPKGPIVAAGNLKKI